MIMLYKKTNTDYSKNGDFIVHPLSAPLHLVLNGDWSLEIELPIETDTDGILKEKASDYVVEGAVFSIDTIKRKKQLYVVDSYEKDETSVVATCYPIFMMDAKNEVILLDVRPTDKNGQEALNIMLQNSEKFSAESDITTINTAYYVRKNFMEALSSDDENSFLNRWGGEIDYDNFKVIVNNAIGEDRGLRVESGFNMTGCSISVDTSELCTRIYPIGYNGRMITDEVSSIMEKYVDSPKANNYRTPYTKFIEYSNVALADDLEDTSETEEYEIAYSTEYLSLLLKQKAEAEFENSNIDVPTITYEINMIDLSNTDKYRDFKDLLYVWLGDFVHVKNKKLNIETVQEVVELEFDCIKKEITSLTLGAVKPNYFQI